MVEPFQRRVVGPQGSIDKFEPTIDGMRSLWPSVAGGGGGGGPFPFDVSFTAGSDASHRTATVRPGTLNGLIPDNILTTEDVDINNTYYLILEATAMDGQIASAHLRFDSSAPTTGIPTTMGEPPIAFEFCIGIIVGDGAMSTWYRTIGNGSLFAEGSEVFRVSKVAPSPGTLPYDIWYTWFIGNV